MEFKRVPMEGEASLETRNVEISSKKKNKWGKHNLLTRTLIVGACLVVLAFYDKNSTNKALRSTSTTASYHKNRRLSSSISEDYEALCANNSAFCEGEPNGECFLPEGGYLYVCCRESDDLCLTAHHNETCNIDHLCSAELVPGGSGAAECLKHWELHGGVTLYIFLLLYCFVGLAIVCDDYFVPSLEKISEGLSLSEDVAGATFMAAGSSAPELFVSLADNVISNPPKSLGIGTIIGSAIFNILVIIGVSALLAGQALQLNWRPFARDCTFYAISVVLLIAVVFEGVVYWWEGLILLCTYFLYVTFMFFNERFFTWVDKKLGNSSPDMNVNLEQAIPKVCENEAFSSSTTTTEARDSLRSDHSGGVELMLKDQTELVDAARVVAPEGDSTSNIRYTVETTRPTMAVEAAAEAIKLESSQKRHGSESNLNIDSMRRKDNEDIHSSPIKNISKNPLHMSKNRGGWKALRREGSQQQVKLKDVAQAVLRANTASKIWMETAKEGQERRAREQAAAAGVPGSTLTGINENEVNESCISGDDDEENGPYFEVLYWPMSEKDKGCCERAFTDWKEMWKARVWYLISFPLNICFRFTIPDCNYDIFCEDKEGQEENRKIGYSLTFIFCVLWIAILSHFLVFFAAKFGCIAGISPPVMGLTILAAGTSVPDALSSVFVARNGQGDMAVANSIGSNVFDILIGLGLPWLIAGLVYEPSIVGVDDLWIGIGFLFGVLVALVLILLVNKWVLQKSVGVILLLLYVFFIIFELAIRPNIKVEGLDE